MSELNLSPRQGADDHNFSKVSFFHRQLPFLAILTLAIAGVAYANISHQPLVGYWEFLALAVGVVCVVTEWAELNDKQARLRLMWTQALHWVAVLVAMNIMLLSGVQQLLPTPATSLVLLILLALGTFLAGTQSSVASNLLSRPCYGSGGSGDLMGQTIGTLFGFSCSVLDRPWHDLLVSSERRVSCKIQAPDEPIL